MSHTYTTYLKLDELLSLQKPLSEAPDELLFIVIHQTYELWFKEALHEIDRLHGQLEAAAMNEAPMTLRRILRIVRVLVAQMDVLETMLPRQFLAFRDLLGSASGFQSRQFRELELALGQRRRELLQAFPEGSEARRRLEARYQNPSLWDAFLRGLAGAGYAVPTELLERDVTEPPQPSAELQAQLLEIYARAPALAYLCERLLDLDESVQEWRYRHVKMVERVIGGRYGTGGSAGAEYLKGTLFKPFFPDLWAIRGSFTHDHP